MSAPDSRHRSKVSLNPSKILSNSIPSSLLPKLVLSEILLVASINAAKEWLLSNNVSVPWVLMRLLAVGGLGVIVREILYSTLQKRRAIEWAVLGMASLLLLVQQACMFYALVILPCSRVILFTRVSIYAFRAFIGRTTRRTLCTLLAFTGCFLADARFTRENWRDIFPAYAALALHGAVSHFLEHTQDMLSLSLGSENVAGASALGATVICLPLYLFRNIALDVPPTPPLSLLALVSLPLIAHAHLFRAPKTTREIRAVSSQRNHFVSSFLISVASFPVIGFLAFNQFPSWWDLFMAGMLYYGVFPEDTQSLGVVPRTPPSRLMKSYLKTILANPESRKIFYFLMLNLCYMLVQMLYGIWTNSLGLISDAIHMAFDCMAIAMGLFASVMATWAPNERFTYGYGRIETLSGFANGIFLILISIFIVFEAVQRLLEPPEMNTNQLLLVSTMGLAVNLFGMYAMGGHHHHGGHSHSHGGHSHGHGHSHAASPTRSHEHSHNTPQGSPYPPEEHLHDEHDHHSHHHDHDDRGHSHSHSHESGGDHSHSHSHSRSQSLSPAPSDAHSQSHSSSPTINGHSHSHQRTHSHSHSPPSPSLPSQLFNSSNSSHSHGHARTQSLAIPASPNAYSPIPPSPTLSSHSHSHSQSPSTHGRTQSMSGAGSGTSTRPNARGLLVPPNIKVPSHGESDGPGSSNSHLSPFSRSAHLNDSVTPSPITPSYRFGQDEHFNSHHPVEGHVANLHDHSHVHDHSAHEGHSDNMRGVFLHVMADTLGSVGVIISTLLIQFYGWTGFDPIASLFIAVLIAASVIPLVIDTGRILCLDVSNKEGNIQAALSELPSIEGLSSYSSPRFWPKDSSSIIGSIHIRVRPSASSVDPTGPHSSKRTVYTNVERVVERVDALLRGKISGLEELTIQVEGQ